MTTKAKTDKEEQGNKQVVLANNSAPTSPLGAYIITNTILGFRIISTVEYTPKPLL